MEMEVRHGLAGDGAVGLGDVDAGGGQALHLGAGNQPDDRDDLVQDLWRGFGQGVEMLLWDDQSVATGDGVDVHEGQHLGGFHNPGRGQRAGADSAEYAVSITHFAVALPLRLL
jgi:hypothetical protein